MRLWDWRYNPPLNAHPRNDRLRLDTLRHIARVVQSVYSPVYLEISARVFGQPGASYLRTEPTHLIADKISSHYPTRDAP
ncbi:hypothetical protein Hypma_007073 [Hypsizygus marmoreus]|uniref:Uncharacterized protein n=1 Tax=Hypsizygus marmoreus TaxID=39966 RepID=A0A369KEV7_HYPMA|nr:hypothetical protein Hypma_007073 [Hypsizygus marmoreus]